VSDGVINIINSHATACVSELEKVNNTKASFDIPNLFDFEETGETLLEDSSENILEKSRAELKIKEIAEQKRLKEEQRVEEERLAKAAQIAEQKRIAEAKKKLKAAKEQKEKRLAEKEKEKIAAKKRKEIDAAKKRKEAASKPVNGRRPDEVRCTKDAYAFVKSLFENAGYTLKWDFEDCTFNAGLGYQSYGPIGTKSRFSSHSLSIYENPKRAEGRRLASTLFCYKYLGGEWKYVGNNKCKR
jgi:hypothetical protein